MSSYCSLYSLFIHVAIHVLHIYVLHVVPRYSKKDCIFVRSTFGEDVVKFVTMEIVVNIPHLVDAGQ